MVKAIIPLMMLAACSTTPVSVENPRSVWCDTNQPWRLPTVAIVMLDRSEIDVLNAHNRQGELWCGWEP